MNRNQLKGCAQLLTEESQATPNNLDLWSMIATETEIAGLINDISVLKGSDFNPEDYSDLKSLSTPEGVLGLLAEVEAFLNKSIKAA
tara:strand:+ start:188 stop:448 length:261 start_codon:yes stop_codon:yes gene_type:complete